MMMEAVRMKARRGRLHPHRKLKGWCPVNGTRQCAGSAGACGEAVLEFHTSVGKNADLSTSSASIPVSDVIFRHRLMVATAIGPGWADHAIHRRVHHKVSHAIVSDANMPIARCIA